MRYLLVSRQFYQDTRHEFYSRNNFVLHQVFPESLADLWWPMSRTSLSLIRHLSFIIPHTYHGGNQADEMLGFSYRLRQWDSLARFIRDHFVVEQLSLTFIDLGSYAASDPVLIIRARYLRMRLKSFTLLQGIHHSAFISMAIEYLRRMRSTSLTPNSACQLSVM